MPVWRLQTAWQLDTTAPRDRMVITPHFNDVGATTDPQNLCDDWLAALQVIAPTTGQLSVTAYDAQGTVPVYPEAQSIINVGATKATGVPRELALCLSFYGERNVPRQRGRLYLPLWFLNIAVPSLRPTLPITAMTALVQQLQDLGGVDVDWCVYSRTLDNAFTVTNWWYDNEWDVQRSRGMVGTSRTQGTTSEATVAGDEVPLV